mgnify:CR=1 FL=1
MITWFARNAVAANLLLGIIVVCGVYAAQRLIPLEIFPESETDVVTITVTQRAATPEDMETGVTNRIEEAIADLDYIDELTSTSAEQVTNIAVTLAPDVDHNKALNEIKSRVDAISTLPVAAERPLVELAQFKGDVLKVVVSGNLDETEINQIARQVRDELVDLPNITIAELRGLRPYEISIEVTQATLRSYGLSLSDISAAINGQALDLSAGQIRSQAGTYILRTKSQAYRYEDFANIVLKRFADGSILRLTDIATIIDGFDENPIVSRMNGETAGFIRVYRVGDESAIQVANAVYQYLEDNQHRFPSEVSFNVWDDDSIILKGRLRSLLNSGWQGGLLIIILLSLFLHPTVALWVVVGIPVCFAGALFLMPWAGISINVLSLFAFILVLGIVVDDAIVTGENIFTHRSNGASGIDASINGTKEIAFPVIFGILTTISAFVPLIAMEGSMRNFTWNIGAVVIFVLIFSLVESKLILPAHLRHLKLNTSSDKNVLMTAQAYVSNGLQHVVKTYYQPLLAAAVARRYLTMCAFIGIFVLTLFMLATGWVRFTFFPVVPAEAAGASLTMPTGTPAETTAQAITRIEQAAFEMREETKTVHGSKIRNIQTNSGGISNPDNGAVRMEINPDYKEPIDIDALVKAWRNKIGTITGAEELTFRAQIFRLGDPISIQLTGNDVSSLAGVIEQIKAKLATYDGVFDIADSLLQGKRELQISLKPEAQIAGLNLQSVTTQVRSAFFGNQAQRVQRGRDDVRVMVKYPEEERRSIADLDELLIVTPQGNNVRFGDIATIKWGVSPNKIVHVERRRALTVSADIDKERVNLKLVQDELEIFMDKLLVDYPSVGYSFEGEAKESRETFSSLFWGLGMVLITIYVLLAIPFSSYTQPFVVMSIIPFSLIGALLGHYIMGVSVSMFSVMGMLALVGVVVNDSLVLVTWINNKTKLGEDIEESVLAAGAARFRAVMLTSATTFAGLLPLMFETSRQAQFLIPMAISMAFGILFATLITLVIVPCNIMILEDIKRSFAWWRGRLTASLSA